jgi:hypothetical protein
MPEVVSPIAQASGTPIAPAPRPQHGGGTLGVLINGKEYSDVVMERLGKQLADRFGASAVLWWNKRYPATPAPFLDEIAERCAFVLNGVGH